MEGGRKRTEKGFEEKSEVLIFNYNVGGMASKGLRAIPYQGIRKVEAGYHNHHLVNGLKTIRQIDNFLLHYQSLSIFKPKNLN